VGFGEVDIIFRPTHLVRGLRRAATRPFLTGARLGAAGQFGLVFGLLGLKARVGGASIWAFATRGLAWRS
jgi:hypothetical protein